MIKFIFRIYFKKQKTLISDEKSVFNKLPTGIEPVAVPYHGTVLPLNYGSVFIDFFIIIFISLALI